MFLLKILVAAGLLFGLLSETGAVNQRTARIGMWVCWLIACLLWITHG